MVRKCKNSNMGNSEMPKTSHNVLPLSKKVKFLDLRGGKIYAEVAKIYSKDKLCVGLGTIHGFKHPFGVLEHIPCE